MKLLRPNFYFKNIFSVNPQFLKKNRIKALLLDADNTLCIYHDNKPIDGVLEWIDEMNKHGISLHILSNGKPGRITEFSKNVNLPCFYMSLKPLPFRISKAIKTLGFKKSDVALIGDQMFTDILGGNLCGITTIWLDYIQIEDSMNFRFKRKLENLIKRKLKKGD